MSDDEKDQPKPICPIRSSGIKINSCGDQPCMWMLIDKIGRVSCAITQIAQAISQEQIGKIIGRSHDRTH